MLVRDPKQRYTIEQIRNHDWLQMDPSVQVTLNMNCDLNSETDSEPEDLEEDERVYNERALRLMENLGIDIPKTKKVRLVSLTFSSIVYLAGYSSHCHNIYYKQMRMSRDLEVAGTILFDFQAVCNSPLHLLR